jgi:hypothetical protein
MTREIQCPQCADRSYHLFSNDQPAKPRVIDLPHKEHIAFHFGHAIVSCLCDSCNQPINPGDNAWAISIWSDRGGIPYYPWEHDFIS